MFTADQVVNTRNETDCRDLHPRVKTVPAAVIYKCFDIVPVIVSEE